MQAHFEVRIEVPLPTKEKAASLTVAFGFSNTGRRLLPCTPWGIGNPVASQAVGNKSTSSTMEELVPGLLLVCGNYS